MIETTAIRARAAAATPGPWYLRLTDETYRDRPAHYYIASEVRGIVDVRPDDAYYVATTQRGNVQARADAEFIAHARQDVAALLAEVERLRDALVQESDEARISAAVIDERDALVTAARAVVREWGREEQDWYRPDYDRAVSALAKLLPATGGDDGE